MLEQMLQIMKEQQIHQLINLMKHNQLFILARSMIQYIMAKLIDSDVIEILKYDMLLTIGDPHNGPLTD